jgi:hypothetical protein
LKLNNPIGEFWNLGNRFLRYLDLSFDFIAADLDHSDIVFHLLDFGFTLSEDVLLDVGLLITDTKFVVSINQLDTDVISSFTDGLTKNDHFK